MKKNILVYLKNGAAELDWLLPVLDKLKKNNNIYFYFRNKSAFKNLQRNYELYFLWKKIYKKFYINKSHDRFFFKALRKLIYKLVPIVSFTNYLPYLDNNINSTDYLEKKFKTNFSAVMCEFDFKNKLVDNFKKKNLVIIRYPSTPKIVYEKVKKKTISKIQKEYCDLLLLSSKYDKKFWEQKFSAKKTAIIGFPKFEESWIHKIQSFNKKNKFTKFNKKEVEILFAYSSRFEIFKNDKLYEEQHLREIIDTLISINHKKVRLNIKMHPRKISNDVEEIVSSYKNKNINLSSNHLYNEGKNCDFFIAEPRSASILDGLVLKKPVVEIWDSKNQLLYEKERDNVYHLLRLSKKVKNKKDLYKILNGLIKNRNLLDYQLKNFKKICGKQKNSSKLASELIDKIIGKNCEKYFKIN